VEPAVFTLTRTGDLTDSLTVSLAWSGDIATTTTVSPMSATFSTGVSTTTVTPVLASVPSVPGALTLMVTSGSGYEPGNPSTAITDYTTAIPSCAFNPPNPAPPILTNPQLTG
jgi:hypothetical protein